ncbi:MAG: hypothetical protein EOO45_17020 [Flavobacterium sp.]|nr:MAG: hypothetical protein EOO45_17020 [Flavobacterium sp.]
MVHIATSIETSVFYSIIDSFKESWHCAVEYRPDIFDKGIDFDYYKFERGTEEVSFAWTNWFEGEIGAEENILRDLAVLYKFSLIYGDPDFLHRPELVTGSPILFVFK